MKLLHLALAAVASANSAAPTEADWLAAVRAAEPEVRDGAFVLLAGASRRELGSWEGVGDDDDGVELVDCSTPEGVLRALYGIGEFGHPYRCRTWGAVPCSPIP